MDLQFIVDVYSCVVYVTSYMLKSEKSMSESLRKVAEECKEKEVQDKLKKIGQTFLDS